jgi:hypothetical protein
LPVGPLKVRKKATLYRNEPILVAAAAVTAEEKGKMEDARSCRWGRPWRWWGWAKDGRLYRTDFAVEKRSGVIEQTGAFTLLKQNEPIVADDRH